jgi:hypothetical protein
MNKQRSRLAKVEINNEFDLFHERGNAREMS